MRNIRLPRPRLRVTRDAKVLFFSHGVEARITGSHHYDIQVHAGGISTRAPNFDEAFAIAWCQARVPAPPPVSASVAIAPREDITDFAAVVRRVLRWRTGHRWSVTSNRRDNTIWVQSCSARLRDGKKGNRMTPHDRALLSSIFDIDCGPYGLSLSALRQTAVITAALGTNTTPSHLRAI